MKSFDEEKKIKVMRNTFRLKKHKITLQIQCKYRHLVRQEKEAKAIKDRILRNILNLF